MGFGTIDPMDDNTIDPQIRVVCLAIRKLAQAYGLQVYSSIMCFSRPGCLASKEQSLRHYNVTLPKYGELAIYQIFSVTPGNTKSEMIRIRP